MKKIPIIILVCILFYTRFVNLGWGLPYPMHPDERNMANAVQQLSCPNYQLLSTNYSLKECFNPHFFAYGQLPLYLAYGGIQIYHVLTGQIDQPTFQEATIALRTISALSSIILVFVLLKIIELIHKMGNVTRYTLRVLCILFFTFSPYAIQLAHFGTTESLLMLFYGIIIYYSLCLLQTTHYKLRTIFLLALFSGLALGTKISSLLFLGVPVITILVKIVIEANPKKAKKSGQQASELLSDFGERKIPTRIYHIIMQIIFSLFSYVFISLFFFLISSPHNILNWNDFISAMNYESAVGLGTYDVFYTRQFFDTVPILFQITNILPFALGWPTLIGGVLGFILLPSEIVKTLITLVLQVARVKGTRHAHRKCPPAGLAAFEHWRGKLRVTESAKYIDLLRFALLLSLLPPSFFFSKWTRFISSSFPLFSLFALLFLLHWIHTNNKNIKSIAITMIIIGITLIPGFSYLSIYFSPDVRVTASQWIYKNIPANSKILSETANVIDLPITTPEMTIPPSTYLINSFNFYDLDTVQQLQSDLSKALIQADYIIVPSRRIFYNHTCFDFTTLQKNKQQTERCRKLENKYPLLSHYYQDLFSGKLGFQKVAEFNSYPTVRFPFINSVFQVNFPDEKAEETWTVFDHPVIRIYKKSSKLRAQSTQSEDQKKRDFTNYKSTNYQLLSSSYSLLVADTPEKWEKGLMYVAGKNDIIGRDGMIFTFPDSQKRMFWNKNTLSPLTLYWIQNKKVIGVSNLPSILETGIINTVFSPSSVDTVIEIIR